MDEWEKELFTISEGKENERIDWGINQGNKTTFKRNIQNFSFAFFSPSTFFFFPGILPETPPFPPFKYRKVYTNL